MSARLPCDGCGAALPVRARDRGRSLDCPACGASTEVPARLDVFDAEVHGTIDRWDGAFLRQQVVVWSVLLLLPAVAFCAWTISGRLRRAREEGRAAEAALVSAWRWAAVCTTLVTAAWIAIAYSLLR